MSFFGQNSSFSERTAVLWSRASQSHEPRQVWKEAALSGLLAVPWGCLGAVVCCENELVKTPWWRLFFVIAKAIEFAQGGGYNIK